MLRSRWHFPLGTQLAIRICAHPVGPEDCPVCEEVTGHGGELRTHRGTVFLLRGDNPLPGCHSTRPGGLGRVADRLELTVRSADRTVQACAFARTDGSDNLRGPALTTIREILVNNAALRRFIKSGRQEIQLHPCLSTIAGRNGSSQFFLLTFNPVRTPLFSRVR